ncbi:MAG: flagellar biosynthesis protein FlhF [Polyangiaceae bacterium]
MQFETFRGRNVEEALAAVRAALGPDAFIESTRHVSNGEKGWLGKSFVEVLAAPADRPSSARSNPFVRQAAPSNQEKRTPASTPARSRESDKIPAAQAPQGAVPVGHRASRAEITMSRELRLIRSMLEEMSHVRKPRDRAGSLLQAAGIEGSLAATLVGQAARVPKSDSTFLINYLRKKLAERIDVANSPIEMPGKRIIACVGPTGVGKTTPLAKLAARASLELGRSVAVVSLDTFRVGAVEQMRRFVELIGVPFDVARDRAGFAQAVAQRRADITLVDTAGVSTADNGSMQRLSDCLSAVTDRPVDILLVVQAAIRARDAERLRGVYRTPTPTGLIITKLDETDQAGGALHTALDHPLPVTYLCDGPRVPEDLHEASAEMLLDAVLPVST